MIMTSENEKAAHQLNDVRQWAKDKLASGQEPPWAWYQYMKLIETADAILSSFATVTTENSPQSEAHQDGHLRLVDSTYPQDTAQHRPSGLPVHLPM
jgi:hypothetical protein